MIYGEHVRLRAPERSDIPMFVSWFNDPEVRQGLSLYRPMGQAEEENWFEGMLKRPADERPLVIEIKVEFDKWFPIGNIGFHNIDWRNRSSEFGIVVGEKEYWDKGYGSESVQLLVKFGFETLNLNRIYLRVNETNHRAIRAYEKVGFIQEGRIRQGVMQAGNYIDGLWMSMLREEWKKNNKRD